MERQQQFKYEKAEISSDKDGSLTIDVRQSIVELVFFESLDKPYITGQIALSDDAAVFDSMDFSGTHRIHIQMMSEFVKDEDKDGIVMDRSFLMTSIETIVKSSNAGNSSIYVFNLIDEHAFVSKSKRISRAIRDNLKTEIIKLCQNEVGKDIDLSYSSDTIQNNFKGIIPYMTPLDAALWLTSKATTSSGMPFFLYASVHDTNLRFASLDKMLLEPAWNAEIPFVYSPANTQKQEENLDPVYQYFQVQTMKATKLQDTMHQLSTGAIGSLYSVLDLGTGQVSAKHFSLLTLLARANDENTIKYLRQNIYDPLYKTPVFEEVNIGGEYLHETNAEIFHKVVSRGVYGEKKSIHDEVTEEMFLKKLEAAALKTAVFKNMMDVTVPGPGFITSGGSVGDKIRINVLSDNTDTEYDDDPLDKMRSGDFLVYNTRHTFRDTRHDVAMTVFKLERGS